MASTILRKTEGSKAQLNILPTDLVLVCGPRSMCDPFILRLADEGYLTLRHTDNRKTLGFDDRSGTVVPGSSFVTSVKEQGVLQSVRATRDGKDYVVALGRNRVKSCAILNWEESERVGKRVEQYRVPVVVFTATEAEAFKAMAWENSQRIRDLPTVRAAKMRDAIDLWHFPMEAVCDLFGEDGHPMSEANIKLNLLLLSLSEEMRGLVDAGKVRPTLAARWYSKFPRDKQIGAYEALESRGIRGGAAAEVALDTLLAGGDLGEALSAAPGGDAPEVPDAAPSGSEAGGKGPKRGGREAAPGKAKVMRAPSKPALARWCDRLKVAAQPLSDFKVPDKYQPAIEAARAEGARLMAARFIGKTLPGWKSIRDIVEAEEAEAEET